jgi:t-SNARE complex subunit (syntaxin)
MVDRYNDLHGYNLTNKNGEFSSSSNSSNLNDGDITILLQPMRNMEKNIKILLDDITRNIKNISDLIDKSLTTLDSNKKQEIKESIDNLIHSIDLDLIKSKKIIDQMGIEKNKKSNSSQTVKRIIDNSISLNIKKFSDCVDLYNRTKRKYEDKTKEKIKRQLIIVDKEKYENISDQQLQQIMETKQNSVFTMDVYNDIQERHSQIIELEKSVMELAQLFQDMQVLVNNQGILIDTIEDNVSKADAHVEKGVEELKDANKYQIKSRKKQCCIIVFILMIVGIIVLILSLNTSKK